MPRLSRRQFVTRTLLGGGVLAAATGAGSVAQAYGLSITRPTLSVPGLNSPLRLVFLTDLHYGPYMTEAQVRRWVEVALAEQPDLILLGGDFVDVHAGETPTPLLRQLARLRAPLGVYGVWGNHDYGSFGRYHSRWRGEGTPDWPKHRDTLAAALAEAGVTLLRNETAQPRSDLCLIGTDDWQWGDPADLPALLRDTGERATLLLTHNPDILPSLPRRIGLTLAGHTHGGQVRLPGIGAVLVPSQYGTRFDMGWKEGAHGSPAYVSRGLGASALPVRMLCPPEIAVLTLNPA